VSLYHIDWSDIQLAFITPSAYFTSNGSAAKSEGVEVALQARPFGGLRVSTWISWDNAVLTQPLPLESATIGNAGDRLPATPKLSGNVSVDQDVPLSANVIGFVGADVQYVGRRLGSFVFASSERESLPPYTQVSVRAGLRYEHWTLNLSLNNAFDKRGVLDGGVGTLNPAGYHYLQPRTGTLSIIKAF
jgi:outer membrane receptor protein involved in Fe transport